MMYRLIGVLSLFTAVWMLSAQDAQVAKLNGKIVLDGKLEEPAWQQAVPHSNFQLMKARNKAGRKPSAQTEFRILADPTHIYLGIRCAEPQMDKIRMIGKDKSTNIWGDDAVEVFLAPCGHKEKYYQFVVNAANTQYRQYYEEAGTIMPEEYGGLFESAVYRGDRFWSVELRIPLAAFYHTAGIDWKSKWLVNVVRTRPHAGEYSSWSVLTGKYHVKSASVPLDKDFARSGDYVLTNATLEFPAIDLDKLVPDVENGRFSKLSGTLCHEPFELVLNRMAVPF